MDIFNSSYCYNNSTLQIQRTAEGNNQQATEALVLEQ